MPGKRKALSEMERDIETYQNDRTMSPDPRMFDQPESEQIIRYPESSQEEIMESYRQVSPILEPETKEYIKSRGYSKGDMVCRGGRKAIKGLKFGGVK